MKMNCVLHPLDRVFLAWRGASFPSPQPSPSGRGRILARASANLAFQARSNDEVRNSLPPREKVGARGKTTFNWLGRAIHPEPLAGKVAHTLSAFLVITVALAASAATSDTATDFPSVVPFEVGMTEFLPGDSITIQSVHGTSPTIRTGETYCVEGTYKLASKDEADLALFATTVSAASVPTEPSQVVRVKKGTGTFQLVKPMREEGYLHVSFYPAPGGSSFGGVYFGQGKWLLPKEGWSALHQKGRVQDSLEGTGSQSKSVTLTGPNQALFEYLGEPVDPPADMDALYSKEGLIKAVHRAADKAGISVRRVEVDDSEYPFLVGIICNEGDYPKLTVQLRKLQGYEFNGGVSSPTHSAMNLVPYRVWPPGTGERIGHRTGLRTQVLFDRIMRRR
jgi:hypothetical protein